MVNNVQIRSSECAWFQAEVKVLGRVIKGLRGFEFKKAQEKEHLYGAGSQPLDIQGGNVAYTGNIKVLGFELDAMNKAAQQAGYADIVDVPHELIVITCKLQKTKIDPKTFYTATGVAFQEYVSAMEQNAKMREVTLPFLAMSIDNV
ncbi:MAG: hypothetical protein QM653_02680 [Dysgonomonas sp.]|uniref:hypothetical protein n=1 Tax=Dysgonomonas sp. TaxID=1891233 RepID=UPI0039E301B9